MAEKATPTVTVKDTAKAEEAAKVLAAEGARIESVPTPLVRLQSSATVPEPKGVPLKQLKRTSNDQEPGPPIPPEAAATPKPRFIHQNERAPAGSGLRRYKIRCLNYGEGNPTRYVLASSEDEARRYYVEGCGIAAVQGALRKDGVEPPEAVLSVRVQPD